MDDKTIDALANLASRLGVYNGVILILALGMATGLSLHAGQITKNVRGILMDFWDFLQKRRELKHRIDSESRAFALELARKSEQISVKNEREPQ